MNTPPALDGSLEIGLKRPLALSTYRMPVGMIDGEWCSPRLDLPAELPMVVGAQEIRLVVVEGRLCGGPDERQAAESLRRAAETFVTRSKRLGVVRSPVLGVVFCDDRRIARHARPRRFVATPCVSDGRTSSRALTRAGAWSPRTASTKVGEFGIDPELVVKALHQLPAGRQLPRELREELVLLVGPRELGIGARLAVVVAQVLVAGEEPQAVADRRAAEIRREVRYRARS